MVNILMVLKNMTLNEIKNKIKMINDKKAILHKKISNGDETNIIRNLVYNTLCICFR